MNRPIERPDSALRAWLEMGPDRGRPEALERALAATRRVPQRPSWTFPERWLPLNRTLVAAAAALILVVSVAVVFLRPAANVGPPVSPSPTTDAPRATEPATVATTANPAILPAELRRIWVGVPHDFPGASDVQALNMQFQFGQVSVSVNNTYGQDHVTSKATFQGADTLELTAVANGCDLGVVGHYRWTLSAGGTHLQLAVLDDPCAARSAALAGEWWSVD